MVNPNRLIKITKAESKDLLDKAQNIIESNILGDKFKGDKLLKNDKNKKSTKRFSIIVELIIKFSIIHYYSYFYTSQSLVCHFYFCLTLLIIHHFPTG